MHQLAKWLRTVRTGHRLNNCRWLVMVCGLLLSALCGCSRAPTDAALFQRINQKLDDGDYKIAIEQSRRAWQRSPDSEWGWRFKLQYALSLLYTDRVDDASRLLKAELPAQFFKLQPRYQYVKSYLRLRQHNPASLSLVKATIEKAEAQQDPTTEADALLLLLRCSGDVDQQSIASQALEVSRRNHLAFQEAAALSELGLMMVSRERYAEAIPYFLQTAALAKRLQAHYLELSSDANLGECYFRLGDLDRALRSLKDAARPLLRTNDPSVLRINVNNELGSLYSLRQQNKEALSYFREAFAIAAPDQGLSSYVPAAESLAEALIEANALDEAEKYNDLATQALKLDSVPNPGLVAANLLNRADIAAQRGKLEDAKSLYSRVLELVAKGPPNAIQWSAYARLAVTEERLNRVEAAGTDFELALNAIESNRSQQSGTDYQITFLSSLIRFYQQYVDFLIRQNQPWNALAVADSSRASVLTQGLISSRSQPDFVARIHRQAREGNTALLFYWLAPQTSYLWAVTPSGDVFQRLPPEAEIERDVKSYSGFIENERQDTLAAQNAVGLRLYQTLLGTVAARLPVGGRVVVVPDGALHGLNFETLLVTGKKAHYWLEDVSLTVAPSLGILLTLSKRTRASGGALVMGDPIYEGTEYPALPESRREVAEVSARFAHGTKVLTRVLTRKQALRGAYASSQPGLFSLIHFSAHVDADPRSPLDSAIILSPGEGGSRLYARDVMAIPLSADLVTISGCRSVGARALSGEGMVGFAWAAFQAGAQNAVTSLWAVDDRSTADLMDAFYEGVTKGKPYATALREAKLQMLQSSYKKPYYWAPFQLYSRNIGAK